MKNSTKHKPITTYYQSPQVEVINVETERGFATSANLTSDVNDWEDGGREKINIY